MCAYARVCVCVCSCVCNARYMCMCIRRSSFLGIPEAHMKTFKRARRTCISPTRPICTHPRYVFLVCTPYIIIIRYVRCVYAFRVFFICIRCVRAPDMCALYVCMILSQICVPDIVTDMCALCVPCADDGRVSWKCVLYLSSMYALYVCLTCMPHVCTGRTDHGRASWRCALMWALYACLISVPCMYAVCMYRAHRS